MGWEQWQLFPYQLYHLPMENPFQSPKLQRELNRLNMAADVALTLRLAANKQSKPIRNQLFALAGRIQLCNHPSNSWFVQAAYPRENGKPADAVGRHWRCGSKLCPSCLARQSQLTRIKLRDALKKQLPNSGRYHFITFTIPNPDLPLLETRSIVNYAWTLFRKRSLCASLIRGGVKSEEFTVTKNGFHYHLHCIFKTDDYIFYNEIRRNWTDCVETSFAAHGRVQMWQESKATRQKAIDKWNAEHPHEKQILHNYIKTDCRQIHPTERSVQEVCKYVTKCDSWSKMNRSDLIEIALIARWCRMFELFGCFAERTPSKDSGTKRAVVHTGSLSDGASPSISYWRTQIEQIDAEVYLLDLETKIETQIQFGLRNLYYQFDGKAVHTFTEILTELAQVA